jgi:hypothetical protein
MGWSVTVTRGTAPAYARAAPRMPVHSARTLARELMKSRGLKHCLVYAVLIWAAITVLLACAAVSPVLFPAMSLATARAVTGIIVAAIFAFAASRTSRSLVSINNVDRMLLPGERRIADSDFTPSLMNALFSGAALGGFLAFLWSIEKILT